MVVKSVEFYDLVAVWWRREAKLEAERMINLPATKIRIFPQKFSFIF
jgi:hypothetical protein